MALEVVVTAPADPLLDLVDMSAPVLVTALRLAATLIGIKLVTTFLDLLLDRHIVPVLAAAPAAAAPAAASTTSTAGGVGLLPRGLGVRLNIDERRQTVDTCINSCQVLL